MYHSYADLKNQISTEELRQLVDDENAGSIIESPANAAMLRVIACGNKASTLIDSYCRGRYTVPLSPVPDFIRDMSVELTVYNCMMRRKEIALSEEQDRRFKKIEKQLKQIQDGTIALYDEVKAPPLYVSNRVDDDRVFTDDVLKGF